MTVPWNQLNGQEKRIRIARSWRLATPTLATIASLLLMMTPVWMLSPLIPKLGLLGVFYWSTTRPDVMPPFAAFLIGFIEDLWLGAPLGLNAGLLLVASLVLGSQHAVFNARPFSFSWGILAALALVYAGLDWCLTMLFWHPISFLPFFCQLLMTLLAFPIATYVHAWVGHHFVEPYFLEAL